MQCVADAGGGLNLGAGNAEGSTPLFTVLEGWSSSRPGSSKSSVRRRLPEPRACRTGATIPTLRQGRP